MLKTAAAQRWQVSIGDVRAENGFVINLKTKAKFSYGELADAAGKLPLPAVPELKKSRDYKVIGKSMKRVDAVEKSNGKAIFGIDVRIPGMLFVVVARPSIPVAKLASFNGNAAKAIKGVVKVVRFDNKVAVLAENTHAARLGRDALKAKWNNGKYSKSSTESFMKDFKEQASNKGIVADNRGSVDKTMAQAVNTYSYEYEFPYLAHATLEPMNCTINYDGKTAEIWAGHQMPTNDLMTAAKHLGLPPDKVQVHTVYAGGSFGRRANKDSDYVVEACEIAKRVKKPMKIVWTREDDMRGGYFRPMYLHQVRIGTDAKNNILAWDHNVVGQSIVKGTALEMIIGKDGVEEPVMEGVAKTAYQLPNFRCYQTTVKTPITTLWWRSVGNTHNAYVMETLIDEMAEKAGKDPFTFRRPLLKDSPRHMAVLDLLEKQVGKHFSKSQEGRAWGLAIHESFHSVVGQVAEVSMQNGMPRVHRVLCAVHCGQVVNPDGAATQIEGGIVFGMSSFFQQIRLQDGEIIDTNYDSYPVIRMQDMPEVFVEFVKTDAPPTGLGEPGVPPIAPAMANAVYKLTKKRLRILPFQPEKRGLS
jgi:isoquinoline 1-oxidoreductase beta subunit